MLSPPPTSAIAPEHLDQDLQLEYPESEPDPTSDDLLKLEREVIQFLNKDMSAWTSRLRRMRIHDSDLAREAKSLSQSSENSLRPQRTAVIGRAGSGKSTVINAILKEQILSTSALGKTCTSFPTEVIYEDGQEYRAVISYVSQDDWRKNLRLLLSDLCEDAEPNFNDTSPAADAKQALMDVYPHLEALFNNPIANIENAVTVLLEDDIVVALLGASESFKAISTETLEEELEAHLNGTPHDRTKPALWSLVDVVRIHGPFNALCNGTILVDLPGYGDRNVARSRRADAYVETVDRLILAQLILIPSFFATFGGSSVCGIERGVDDEQTREWIIKCIKRFVIFDNHQVEGGLMIIVTGLDKGILDKDIRTVLTDDQKLTLNGFQQQAEEVMKRKRTLLVGQIEAQKRLRKQHKFPLERSIAEKDLNSVTAKILLLFFQFLINGKSLCVCLDIPIKTTPKIQREDITGKAIAKQKQIFFSNIRKKEVRSSMRNLFRDTLMSLKLESHLNDIGEVPVFVIGAIDYFCLSGITISDTQWQAHVFDDTASTGVPTVQAYIRAVAQKRVLSTMKDSLLHCKSFIAKAQGRARLTAQMGAEDIKKYEEDANYHLDVLKMETKRVLQAHYSILDADQNKIEAALHESAVMATAMCPDTIKKLDSLKGNSYQAMMRRLGVLGDKDLNHHLVQIPMQSDDIYRKWHQAFGKDIPQHLMYLTQEIGVNVDRTRDGIVACAPPSIRTQLRNVGEQLNALGVLASARGCYLRALEDTQRSFKGNFANILQKQLTPHYTRLSEYKGSGMLARIKRANVEYFTENAVEIFHLIVDEVSLKFQNAHEAGRNELEEAIDKLYEQLQNSLIRVQNFSADNATLEKETEATAALIEKSNNAVTQYLEAIDSRLEHLFDGNEDITMDIDI
ncbi:hypothetical protein BJ138DRAFT_1105309 [Hygrophoropsis aurantiaca]|uniref:Uncharacterized protein n=1 Tax=Hygrophoropsis aurantiaca TaxID=72124 RepID=A0ACB7ZYM8_9AGAM|nr:hypothetical protein BJ138DRAFT_1105309 [Hygrophoropsis aurantiaca]